MARTKGNLEFIPFLAVTFITKLVTRRNKAAPWPDELATGGKTIWRDLASPPVDQGSRSSLLTDLRRGFERNSIFSIYRE